MTKKKAIGIFIQSIFLIFFNIIFFMNLSFKHSTSGWICYAFLFFSYLMVIFTPFFDSKEYTSKISSYFISSLFFLSEIIFCIIFGKFSQLLSIKLIITIQLILTMIFLIVFSTNILTNESIKNKKTQHDVDNNFIKVISSKARYIESIITYPKLKSQMSNLYFTLHSSPTKSCTEANIYEKKILDLIQLLETTVEQDDEKEISTYILEIEKLINKRNIILKTNHST